MILVHKMTDLYLQHCASTAVCQIAESIVLAEVWLRAGEVSPDKPYRGQVALAIAL